MVVTGGIEAPEDIGRDTEASSTGRVEKNQQVEIKRDLQRWLVQVGEMQMEDWERRQPEMYMKRVYNLGEA